MCTTYTRLPPLTYSVKAKATRPNIANLPFHSSALELIIPFEFDSALTPLNNGINDANVRTTLVPTNHGIPPFAICSNTSCPFDTSTASAATNPIIASRPLILSGPGPLNAKMSVNFVLVTCEYSQICS